MSSKARDDQIKGFFEKTFETYGATAQGMDWNSEQARNQRFDQLLKVCAGRQEFSILDYGCGYGALVSYLQSRGYRFRYTGFDLSEVIIASARQIYQDVPQASFTASETELEAVDYTVANGIFNKKFDASNEDWTRYVVQNLDTMDRLSRSGFAVNFLTSYSDPDRMRPDLYYADPCFFFDHCKRHYSRNVALLHDYDLYDFTIIVRK